MSKISDFKSRLSQLPSEIWSKIAKIDELKGQWVAGAKLDPQVLGRLKRSVLVTSTGASTRIEGSKLTDEDVKALMRGISIQRLTDRDEQEVRGYFELLTDVFNAWEDIKLSESTIKHFHREILKYTDKDERHRGDYKKIENRVEATDGSGKSVVIFETTPAYLTPKGMQELVAWTIQALASKEYHSLIIIGNFIVEFLKIHPFQDGNGRLSRVLTNLLLLQAGYLYVPYVSHEKIVEEEKSDYYVALRKSQGTFGTDHENVVPWLNFFLNAFYRQSKSAIELLSFERVEKLLSPKQLVVWRFIVTVPEATPGEIVKQTGIARPTVNQVLAKLLNLKRIERLGQGRGTRYKKIV